ncbi:MAG: thiamine ABC transporter substrate-binding protein [Candidatus Micrarchaeota archaeon]
MGKDILKVAVAIVALLLFAYLLDKYSGSFGDNLVVATIAPSDAIPSAPFAQQQIPELVVYTYDGITADWGLGPKIFPEFENECGCKLKVVAKGDVGAFVSQLIFEKNSPKADIALGFDNTFLEKMISEDLLEPFKPGNYGEIMLSLQKDDFRSTPFDWGYMAFVYDSGKIANPPSSLEDLTKPEFSKKIILEDARTSSPGKAFLHWVVNEYGEGTGAYLQRLKPNLLTIAPGWSEAYNLFLAGEAPIVLSYSTSPAYHMINENTTKYKAAIFPNMFRQVEYVGIVKGSTDKQLSQKFIEFMISKNAQEEIPLGNYMYPVRSDVPLPDAFDLAEEPEKIYPVLIDDEKWLRIWEGAFSG